MWPLLCRVWRLSPGLGVASLVPDRCGDEVLAGVWPCEYCNMERDLSRALNMIYPSNCAEQLCRVCRLCRLGWFAMVAVIVMVVLAVLVCADYVGVC